MTIRPFALVLLLCAPPLLAQDVRVDDPWIRAAPPGARMLAGYARLHNAGETPRNLLGASSERFGLIEIHRTVEVDGVARMRQVDAVEIPAGGSVALEPGGLHLMLMRPVADVGEGERIALRLRLDDGSELMAEFEVRRSAVRTQPDPRASHD